MINIPSQNIRLLTKIGLSHLKDWTSISLDLQNFIHQSPNIEMQNTDVIFEYDQENQSFMISRPITGHSNSEMYEIRDISMKSYNREDFQLDFEGDFSASVANILKKGDLIRLTFLPSSIKITIDRIV